MITSTLKLQLCRDQYLSRLSDILLQIGIFILSIATTLQCQTKPVSFQLEKVKEIPLQLGDGNFIGKIYDMARDGKGRFYLVDKQAHTVWVVNGDGKLLRKIGQLGQGPGELNNPVSIVCRSNQIAVLEDGNKRVSILDNHGEFLSSFRIGSNFLSGMEFCINDSTMIISESLGLWSYRFYSVSGGPLKSAGRNEQNTPILMPVQLGGGNLSMTSDGTFLFSPIKQYQVIRIDCNGDTLAVYQANPPGYRAPNLESKEASLAQESLCLICVPLEVNNMILIQRISKRLSRNNKHDQSWHHVIDLFSLDSEPIQLDIPSPSLVFLMTDHDLLYGIDDSAMTMGSSNPAIVVYSLSSRHR